nr:immunoglobulin heavy chain junction region [Mus musculus]MBK4187238.1 immunoglobulin heavy chain junction region [Mus musculus]MBK4187239.1 immunoglobulin heavy chain junction region [Mus musculus]MBK4187240.1 immunoglobulin heavy chain junction region [Mus musculus]MBK4187241.1 immunoglobulin heavy chain junction region [Mus musculus]
CARRGGANSYWYFDVW